MRNTGVLVRHRGRAVSSASAATNPLAGMYDTTTHSIPAYEPQPEDAEPHYTELDYNPQAPQDTQWDAGPDTDPVPVQAPEPYVEPSEGQDPDPAVEPTPYVAPAAAAESEPAHEPPAAPEPGASDKRVGPISERILARSSPVREISAQRSS